MLFPLTTLLSVISLLAFTGDASAAGCFGGQLAPDLAQCYEAIRRGCPTLNGYYFYGTVTNYCYNDPYGNSIRLIARNWDKQSLTLNDDLCYEQMKIIHAECPRGGMIRSGSFDFTFDPNLGPC